MIKAMIANPRLKGIVIFLKDLNLRYTDSLFNLLISLGTLRETAKLQKNYICQTYSRIYAMNNVLSC